ncbi:MAG TPA: hypothetical protein VM695_09095 [Phycisphaerae bacterium]|nr:hypothetical protein [Phycisphaerae bacterium]
MLAMALTIGQVLEAGMLICFGFSWPVDILKTWRAKRTEGKSLIFMSLILTGYLFGLSAKLVRAAQAGETPERVTALYVVNAVLIAVDIALTWYYRVRPPVAPAGT